MNGTLRGRPNLSDVHIPPLRDPQPNPRVSQAPLPLELLEQSTSNDDDVRGRLESGSAKEPKKPHLAISELLDAPSENDIAQVQLPSFVSLSVVEKSPTQSHLNVSSHGYPHKRPRLESETDVNRLLPRPIQKDDKQELPLLPAMVTGLNDPPPSVRLLPSMDTDGRPVLQRNLTSKMQVQDMLQQPEKISNSRPPEQMLNTPEVAAAELPKQSEPESAATDPDTPPNAASPPSIQAIPKKDAKVRRTRRKWSETETTDLLAGVRKHGFGKWKQILNDSAYTFVERTSIDLKDRFRVFAKDYPEESGTPNSDDVQPENSEISNSQSNSTNRQRRKRHPWTKEEDQALLSGVQKYGFQWTDIHNDKTLDLQHRRATDLRDRIRNLYPDGYKHAEARPLRAEVKRAEKAGKKETPAGTLYAPPSQMDLIAFSASLGGTAVAAVAPASSPAPARRQTTSGKVPSIAHLTSLMDDTSPARPLPRRSKTIADTESAGITLPSLALNGADDEEWDNTLPPFINWEHDI